MRDLFGIEIAAPYAGHNEVSFNFGTVLSRAPGLSRRKGADLKVPNTHAAHVCLYKYSASRKNKRHLLDRQAGFETVNSDIQCLVIKGYLKLIGRMADRLSAGTGSTPVSSAISLREIRSAARTLASKSSYEGSSPSSPAKSEHGIAAGASGLQPDDVEFNSRCSLHAEVV